ncbi:B3 domain-containing transcription factor VRN1 isoform X7 [Mangifera indica]|uniref:B3 domain-containing transcription factor VRN1 isoform X7 n=1 Tax=Mangifera indica TaxID=29780 RepID=UPI001CFC28F3|nr:B3 domain-containing transcription factor VRN1 isoform X7 [Mangifera indica]
MPRSSFHKLILSSTIRERKLRIPENFVKKFKDELSVAATLMVPNGNVSRVGLKRVDNKIWFYDGWQEFMERYSIRIGYFLVFKYEGHSSFNVHIYNLPSSEINYHSNPYSRAEAPYHSKQYRIFEEMEDDDSEVGDRSTLSKTFNPPTLQNLLTSSKYDSSMHYAGEANLHRSKDGELERLKKSGRKKQKIEPKPVKVQIIRIHQLKKNMREKCALDFMKVLRQEREQQLLKKEKERSMQLNLLSQPILSAGLSCDHLTYIGGVLCICHPVLLKNI